MATGGVRALDARQIVHEGWAINHNHYAVQTMLTNHPHVHVMEMDLTTVIPSEVIPCRHLDHLHASPSCTHHSRAKGGRPRSNQLRAQPNLVLDWLDDIDVSFLSIENVPEFMDWGPLDYYGRPIERLKVRTSRRGFIPSKRETTSSNGMWSTVLTMATRRPASDSS